MAQHKPVLVTGGAGYIGSHTCVELLNAGYSVVVLDNLSNSSETSICRVEQLTQQTIPFYNGDIRDARMLDRIFAQHEFAAVIHFAGLKAVGESVEKPLAYYDNNVNGTLVLLQAMQSHGVKTVVFSSSATVYGDPHSLPIAEDFPLSATNPYGRSKLMIEEILRDLASSDPEWSVALLRYFNPIGAHESGKIGEDPAGIPNNLMPYIARVAAGKLPYLSVFGSDYPTPDGTGVRDYIHVVDLARGHLKALQRISQVEGAHAWNLGTGQGYSVLDMIKCFERVSGRTIPYRQVARRAGDIPSCYADPTKACKDLGWKAEKGIDDMCADGWRWQSMNPDGYRPAPLNAAQAVA